jgi:thymidylate synthase
MLPLPIAFECLKPISRRLTQIAQRPGIVEQQQLTPCLSLDDAKARHILVRKQARRRCVPE